MKKMLKRGVFLAFLLAVSPLVLASWLEKQLLGGAERVFVIGAHLVALMPGFVGSLMRSAYYWATLDECHWETNIGFGTVFSHRGASVGPYLVTGSYCMLGHVDIGRGVQLASRVSIPSGRRPKPGAQAGSPVWEYAPMPIGADARIGESAVVLAPVGARAIVGAGSVVEQPVPQAQCVAGNPARERASNC
ncbi:MAG: hypothetical protein R3E68_14265 [Burkholderiaceae bacterium]